MSLRQLISLRLVVSYVSYMYNVPQQEEELSLQAEWHSAVGRESAVPTANIRTDVVH